MKNRSQKKNEDNLYVNSIQLLTLNDFDDIIVNWGVVSKYGKLGKVI